MPVAHADIHRQVEPVVGQRRAQGVGLTQGDGLERRVTVEQRIVGHDRFEPLGRDGAAAQHVGQKGTHLVHVFRAAKGEQQDRVKRHGDKTQAHTSTGKGRRSSGRHLVYQLDQGNHLLDRRVR